MENSTIRLFIRGWADENGGARSGVKRLGTNTRYASGSALDERIKSGLPIQQQKRRAKS